MSNEVLNMADYTVEIAGESYNLTTIPEDSSKLVEEKRNNVLKTIKLGKLVRDLSRTGDLINLAYNATPAKFGELRRPIGELHDRFGVLCGECVKEMGKVELATDAILKNLKRVFTFLLKGKDDIAISILSRCSEQAQTLHESMDRLHNEFEGLAEKTVTTLGKTESERGNQLQKAEELQNQAKELEANLAKTQKLADDLANAKNELQKMYNEAKEKAESAEDRAFALSMVGAILGPIGEGVGAFAGVYTRSTNPLASLTPPPTPQPASGNKTPANTSNTPASTNTTPENGADSAAVEKLKLDAEEAAEKVSAAEEEKQAADTAEEEAKSKLDEAENAVTEAQAKVDEADSEDEEAKKQAESDLEAAKTGKQEAEMLHQQKQEKADKAGTSLETAKKDQAEINARYAAAMEAASQIMTGVGENMEEMGDGYAAIAEGYRKEKLKYLDLMMQKQDQEREALASIQKYAMQMKNIGEQEQTAEVAAAALFQAIGALKKIVVVLRDASLFWSNMALHCKTLASPEIKADIELYKDLAEEEKFELYRENDFKESVVGYYASWVALRLIAKEYLEATATVRENVLNDYQSNLNEEEARALASSLGEKLLDDISGDIAAIEGMKGAIKEAQEVEMEEAA